ncbi:MAG: methyltransferase domain-containing protein [Paludibacter sp.]
MKFEPKIIKHLSGELFSAGLDISFSNEKYPNQTRIEKILEITKNKSVIHVGCADHLPLIETKIKNNKWLHRLLIENTTQCIGVDNNEEAVNFINNKLNIRDVYCFDITSDNVSILDNSHWDYMILGEIIEHIDNPVAFLTKIKEKYTGKVDKILITAPNVFNILTIKDIKSNIENINTDHRYWFSPFTLTKVMIRSGFNNCDLTFADRVKLPLFQAVARRLKIFFGITSYFYANCFSNLIIVADFE